MPANAGASASRMSAARASTAARSATGRRLHAGNARAAAASLASTAAGASGIERAQALAGRRIDTFDGHELNVTHAQATLWTDAGGGSHRGAGDLADGRVGLRGRRDRRVARRHRARPDAHRHRRDVRQRPRGGARRAGHQGIPRARPLPGQQGAAAERQPCRDRARVRAEPAPAGHRLPGRLPPALARQHPAGRDAGRDGAAGRAGKDPRARRVELRRRRPGGGAWPAAPCADRLQPGALPPARAPHRQRSWSPTAAGTTSRSSATARSATAASRTVQRRRPRPGRRRRAPPRHAPAGRAGVPHPRAAAVHDPEGVDARARGRERRRAGSGAHARPTSPRSTPPSRSVPPTSYR